jgi:nucleoside-diphosphate-sugar epimerase
MLKLASEIIELTNSKSEIIFQPLPSDDPRDREPVIAKAKELLGWAPKVSRTVGLELTINDVRNQIEAANLHGSAR